VRTAICFIFYAQIRDPLNNNYRSLGAVHKRRPQSGGFPLGPFCDKGEGLFRCGRPHRLVQKTSEFSIFMMCSHRQGTFCEQGGRSQFFTILCGRLLWTAPYQNDAIENTNERQHYGTNRNQ